MSSSSSDWGGSGDYSFLLQSIEGKIGAVLPESPIQYAGSVPSTSAKKRTRLSIDDHDFSIDEDNTITNTLKASSNLKSLVEFDELRLENERLREKLILTESENQANKERILRQLSYLEEQYGLTKKELQSKSEKYFEDKKKWQVKVRELECQLQKQSSSAPSRTLSTASLTVPIDAGREEITRKLAQLESAVVSKSKELNAANTMIAKLETDLLAAKQELLSSTPARALNSQDPQESEEMKDMRLRCQDLELSLKRKARDIEKLESRLKNQKLLEEEVATATSKYSLSQETIKKFEAVEAKYLKLVDERNQWKQLFQGVLKTQQQQNQSQQSSSHSAADGDVNPVAVLRLLSASQEKCSLLLKAQSDLEQQTSTLTSKVLRLEAKAQEAERSALDLNHRITALTNQNNLLTQHSTLYEGEIQSMRTLLKTYDMEFGLGKTGVDSVVALKNKEIEALTQQLDKCRPAAGSLVERLQALEKAAGLSVPSADGTAAGAAVGTTAVSESEMHNLKLEADMLRMELSALKQVTGMDFIPGRTKVLHLADNPSAAAAAKRRQSTGSIDASSATSSSSSGGSGEEHSTIPMDELKRLRRENKELSAALHTAGSANGGEHNSTSVASSASATAPAAPTKQQHGDALNQSVMGGICPSCVAGLADSNKHNQRLKEMFKERITSFREAVYLLTGYKIELHTAENGGSKSLPKLRCRSMFAEKSDDCLLFQWKGDTLELLDTEFASKLDSKLFTVLTTCNSVPAFMASVTLDLFEHQTFMGQTL